LALLHLDLPLMLIVLLWLDSLLLDPKMMLLVILWFLLRNSNIRCSHICTNIGGFHILPSRLVLEAAPPSMGGGIPALLCIASFLRFYNLLPFCGLIGIPGPHDQRQGES
jgi:hypothetical protein